MRYLPILLSLCLLPSLSPAGDDPAASGIITEAKMKAFLAYLRAASQGAGGAGQVVAATAAGAKPGEAPKAKLGGEGMAEMGEAARRGQRESGLTQAEIARLTSILTPYYAKRSTAVEAVAGLKRYGDMPRMAAMFNQWIKEGEQAREAFRQQHGEAALKAVDAAEPEYFAIEAEALDRAAGKKK